MPYILSIDQSTSCTKALLFDEKGNLCGRADKAHTQIINDKGWVEHNPEEIYANLLAAVQELLRQTGVSSIDIAGAAISNQRETTIVWDHANGKPVYNAIVWQCGRAKDICDEIEKSDAGKASLVKQRTGIHLSPFFSAPKMAWILRNVDAAQKVYKNNSLVCSTIDSWLIYKLTKERCIKTDYSNACRTLLFNIHTLRWDADLCHLFGLDVSMLPQVCDSDSLFGMTDFEGILDHAVPLYGVMGDSQGALFAQGCLSPGMVKATYGTGSSIMMNVGNYPVVCEDLVTSIAWGLGGTVCYVLEGNINYSGATIQWLKNDVQLITSAKETCGLAKKAVDSPGLYLVPAFTGLGAPYWNADARAIICGMSRTTGKAELVRAAEESIVYQITDILYLMEKTIGAKIKTLRVDGGPTADDFLMQFQADMVNTSVRVAAVEELSGMGPAIAAGLRLGLYDTHTIFNKDPKVLYSPCMAEDERKRRYDGWQRAVRFSLDY
ncbi:MAG: glycerol kinase GlpK [Treponema sp.]|nr:glycerol kinase GlpK [Treponema sp.]